MSLGLALLVGIGGAAGSLMRYGVGHLMKARHKPVFYGTLGVNLAGSMAIGFFIGLEIEPYNQAVYAFSVIGVLGGLTTYSTLNVQAAEMVKERANRTLAGYLIATYVGSVVLTAIGVTVGHLLHT